MKAKINIAEILKDCPKGIELYSPICGKCNFNYIQFTDSIIKVSNKTGVYYFAKDGTYTRAIDAECLLFPSKDNRDWSTFQRPFKDGDIVATSFGDWIGITTGGKIGEFMPTYCVITGDGEFEVYFNKKETWQFHRLATEEEKAKLFQTIKDNGYRWNEETKTLEKLPKFKVGDEIVKRNSITNSWIVSSVSSEYYGLKSPNGIEGIGVLPVSKQDEYELVLNKFDVINFKPFMKVLVRTDNSDVWQCDFFSSYNPKCSNRFHCIGACYNICIPYIGNEHLRGTTEDCDEFYKNW